MNHDMMETFLPKTNCDCDLAQSRHVQFETDLHEHKDKHYRNIAIINKQPHQQGNSWPKAAIPGFCGSLPPNDYCFKELHQVVHYPNITSF